MSVSLYYSQLYPTTYNYLLSKLWRNKKKKIISILSIVLKYLLELGDIGMFCSLYFKAWDLESITLIFYHIL